MFKTIKDQNSWLAIWLNVLLKNSDQKWWETKYCCSWHLSHFDLLLSTLLLLHSLSVSLRSLIVFHIFSSFPLYQKFPGPHSNNIKVSCTSQAVDEQSI